MIDTKLILSKQIHSYTVYRWKKNSITQKHTKDIAMKPELTQSTLILPNFISYFNWLKSKKNATLAFIHWPGELSSPISIFINWAWQVLRYYVSTYHVICRDTRVFDFSNLKTTDDFKRTILLFLSSIYQHHF